MSSLILSLIYRTAGVWGAGKGSNLDPAEVDANFHTLEQALEEIADSPLQPKQIFSIDVTGNQMTITLDDGVTIFGPFTLPTASFKWREAWAPTTSYLANDLFAAQDGLYFVNRDFTSGATFVPSLGTGIGGALPYASQIMPFPVGVDISFFYPGKPGTGMAASVVMFGFMTGRDFYLPAGLTGAAARLDVDPAADLDFVMQKDGVDIGLIHFPAAATSGTFTFTDDVQFLASGPNKLQVLTPAGIDTDASNFYLTIRGVLGVAPVAESSS